MINELLVNGIDFEVKKRSVLSKFSKTKTRIFRFEPCVLATLTELCNEFTKIDFDSNILEEDGLNEVKRIVGNDAKVLSRIAAIAYLNSHSYIPFATWLYSIYFRSRVDTSQLIQLTNIIFELMNLSDFVNSIRYFSVSPRTTKPAISDPELISQADEK